MKRAKPFKTASILVGLVVVALMAISACADQAEGERCESANGNDDCDQTKNLVCVPAALLTNTVSDRCCPADRSTATTAVCKTPVVVGGDASAPVDSGPSTTPDATTTPDASTTTDGAVSDATTD